MTPAAPGGAGGRRQRKPARDPATADGRGRAVAADRVPAQTLDPGVERADVERAVRRLAAEKIGARLWNKDASIWSRDPAQAAAIRDRLGWLDAPDGMQAQMAALAAFAAEARRSFGHVVLLGMGGSSLCPEVMRAAFGARRGWPRLIVLDTTDPTTILATERAVDLERTLFIVSSKSGGTIESRCLQRYFFEKARARAGGRAAANQFIAITDPGSPLAREAEALRFRRVFVNPPDIGGRFSALSLFGLAPMALIGIDAAAVLERGRRMASACAPDAPAERNPGLALGAALGALARAGRNKVTFLLDPRIGAFGLWLEQLLAESTGKQGRGLVPIHGETPGPVAAYGADRVFVAIGRAGAAAARLARAGFPVARIALEDRLDLGGEYLRWEIATAVAGAVLEVNPFDEPNVAESKRNTAEILARAGGGAPDDGPPRVVEAGVAVWSELAGGTLAAQLEAFLAHARPDHYIALQAYLPYDARLGRALAAVRMTLRDGTACATMCGFGPRYLHSTGQLHKGGPPTGIFLQLTADDAADASIPDEPYSFGRLKAAQALGDYRALVARGRPVLRLHLGRDAAAGLKQLERTLVTLLQRNRK